MGGTPDSKHYCRDKFIPFSMCVYYMPLDDPALYPASPNGHLQLCRPQQKWSLEQGGGTWDNNNGRLARRIMNMLK